MDFSFVEEARLTCVKKMKTVNIISFSVFVFFIVLGTLLNGFNFFISFVIFFAFGMSVGCYIFLSMTYYNYELARYRDVYKNYFVEQSLNKTFTDLHYDRASGIDSNIIFNTSMIKKGDHYSSNDLISGKYHGVNFSQSDVEITISTSDSLSIIFHGRWIIFEFPKKFVYRIEVVQKDFPDKKIPEVGPSGRKFEQQVVESSKFHDKFEIYAESGLEAFYVLDPALIDRIITLSDNCKGKLLLCFVDNRLHIALHDRKDAFEPPDPMKELDEKVEFDKVNSELKTITDFIDYLKLDKKIFVK